MTATITPLRKLRREQELTLAQVGERAGCTAAYVSLVELGKRRPRARLRVKLAQAVGATSRELFG